MAERPKTEQPGTTHESRDRTSTAPPPFDMEEYARSSESTLAAEPVEEPQRAVLRPTPTRRDLGGTPGELRRANGCHRSRGDAGCGELFKRSRGVSSVPAPSQPTDLPSVESIPTLSVPKGELAWFGHDEDARRLAVLANGRDSIGAVALDANVDPAEAQQLFAELAYAGAVDLR